MKLFITNKNYFEESLEGLSPQIHKRAFNQLRDAIEGFNIPLFLMPINSIGHESVSIFQFVKVVGDVYFYEFTGTAS
jgi:hypothetical protein